MYLELFGYEMIEVLFVGMDVGELLFVCIERGVGAV